MRNSAIGILCLLCAACAASSQTPDKPASVEGTVLNSVTGEPLLRAHVSLRSYTPNGKQYGALTTADGKFSITGIDPGSYVVTLEKVGFSASPGKPAAQFQLKPDEKKIEVKLTLIPVGGIVGHVTDSEGNPVENASVTAQAGSVTQRATTDDQGAFRVGGLTPGRYTVKAAVPQFIPTAPEIRTDGTVEVHNAATWFPGVISAKQAAIVTVAPGVDANGIDIRFAKVPFVRVSGKVIGLGKGETSVVFARQGSDTATSSEVKPDGSFEMWRLDPGKYQLVVGARNQASLHNAPLDIEVAGSNLENLELRLVPDSTVVGRVEYEDDAAKKALQPLPPGTRMQQQPALRVLSLRALGAGSSGSPPAQIDAADAFRMEKVQAGRYRVGIVGGPGVYVKSMRLGSRVIDGSILDLSEGSGGADLTVLLSAATGSISIRITDNDPANAVIVLAAADPEDQSISPRFASATADGTYTIDKVTPGQYNLVAVQASETNAVVQRGGLNAYDGLMERVDVGAGDKIVKDLKRRTPGER